MTAQRDRAFVQHRKWMARAIAQALRGRGLGYRPFGAVIVDSAGYEVSVGFGSETREDPCRHSEVIAIKQAARARYRHGSLDGCTLYSTHEPCVMCIGAINHAKLSRVVYGSARSDLPELFRQRTNGAYLLLADTSHPPEVLRFCIPECIALFDEELLELREAQNDTRAWA